MVKEAVPIFPPEKTYQYTVADGTGISEGAILKLTDPRTAVLNDGLANPMAGIAAADKQVNDGAITIGVHKKGPFKVFACGAILLGDRVVGAASPANHVSTAAKHISGAQVLGYAEELVADGETFALRLDL